MTSPQAPTGSARTLLGAAAVVVLVQSVVFVALAALDLRDTPSERLGSGIGVAVLLAGFGVAQLVAVRLLLRGRRAARSPLVVTQILLVLVGYSLWGPETKQLALAAAVPAVVVLACLLAPPVTRALTDPAA